MACVMKVCVKCGKEKPETQFHWCTRDNKYRNPCRECKLAYNKKWKASNPEKTAAYHRKILYGITKDEYDILFKAQGGVCAICENECHKTLSVDHCHKTDKIRGLLCNKCNTALGLFQDSLDNLEKAIGYLRRETST